MGIVGTVDHHERLVPEYLEPAWPADRSETFGNDIGVERLTEERLGCGKRDRGVVALVPTMKRHEHIGIHRGCSS